MIVVLIRRPTYYAGKSKICALTMQDDMMRCANTIRNTPTNATSCQARITAVIVIDYFALRRPTFGPCSK